MRAHSALWSIGEQVGGDGYPYAVLTFRTCTVDHVTGSPIVTSYIMDVSAAELVAHLVCGDCEYEGAPPPIPWPMHNESPARASRN